MQTVRARGVCPVLSRLLDLFPRDIDPDEGVVVAQGLLQGENEVPVPGGDVQHSSAGYSLQPVRNDPGARDHQRC